MGTISDSSEIAIPPRVDGCCRNTEPDLSCLPTSGMRAPSLSNGKLMSGKFLWFSIPRAASSSQTKDLLKYRAESAIACRPNSR
jgi:hypothetical protein